MLSLSACFGRDADILLQRLCELELEYDELYIYEVHGNTSHTHSVVSACAKTLTHLKLGPDDCKLQRSITVSWVLSKYRLTSPADSIRTLEGLSELRQLTFFDSSLLPEEVSLISTITSTNIQKIVFEPFSMLNFGERFQPSLDTELSGLIDRLRASGYKHTLELEFRLTRNFGKNVLDVRPDWFFPKFTEKGRVIVSETSSGRTYCSDASIRSDLYSGD